MEQESVHSETTSGATSDSEASVSPSEDASANEVHQVGEGASEDTGSSGEETSGGSESERSLSQDEAVDCFVAGWKAKKKTSKKRVERGYTPRSDQSSRPNRKGDRGRSSKEHHDRGRSSGAPRKTEHKKKDHRSKSDGPSVAELSLIHI